MSDQKIQLPPQTVAAIKACGVTAAQAVEGAKRLDKMLSSKK